jgi:hypothetical protein
MAAIGACAKTPPRTPVVTAMAIPTPPPHVLIPTVLPEPVEPTPVEPELPATAPAAPRRPPAAAARPAERPASPPATESNTPAPVLQTTADPRAQEEAIKAKVIQAEMKLNALNRNDLNVSARAQYDQARGFIRQAHEALRVRNYLYAEQLARKAVAVANQLARG